MAPLKRLACVSLVALGALCLYLSMDDVASPKGELLVFRRESGRFLQLPDVDCQQDPPFLVVLVTSGPEQAFARTVIRDTWGRAATVSGRRIRTFFLLGSSPRQELSRAVAQEGRRHGDLIQKDFLDAYVNLTLKTMMGMQWVHVFCPQAAFVMKTDSDVFVNARYLTELLLRRNRTRRFFTGFLKLDERPIRRGHSKWAVSRREYPWDAYPAFCSGTGYVFSGDVASRVLDVSERVPFIRLEDVFVGLCLAELGIRPEPLHREQTFFPGGLRFSTCGFRKIVTCHLVRPRDMLLYWRALESSLEEECPAA